MSRRMALSLSERAIVGPDLLSGAMSRASSLPLRPASNARRDSGDPETLACFGSDGVGKLDFGVIIVIRGRGGTKGLPAGVSATRSRSG